MQGIVVVGSGDIFNELFNDINISIVSISDKTPPVEEIEIVLQNFVDDCSRNTKDVLKEKALHYKTLEYTKKNRRKF